MRVARLITLLFVAACYESHARIPDTTATSTDAGPAVDTSSDEWCPSLAPRRFDGFCVPDDRRVLPAHSRIELEVIAHHLPEFYGITECVVTVDAGVVQLDLFQQELGGEHETDERCRPWVPGPACTLGYPLEPRGAVCEIPPLDTGSWTFRFGEREELLTVTTEAGAGSKTCWSWSEPSRITLEGSTVRACVGYNHGCSAIEVAALVSDCADARCRSTMASDDAIEVALERPPSCVPSGPHIHPCWASWRQGEPRREQVVLRSGGVDVTLTGPPFQQWWCADLPDVSE